MGFSLMTVVKTDRIAKFAGPEITVSARKHRGCDIGVVHARPRLALASPVKMQRSARWRSAKDSPIEVDIVDSRSIAQGVGRDHSLGGSDSSTRDEISGGWSWKSCSCWYRARSASCCHRGAGNSWPELGSPESVGSSGTRSWLNPARRTQRLARSRRTGRQGVTRPIRQRVARHESPRTAQR